MRRHLDRARFTYRHPVITLAAAGVLLATVLGLLAALPNTAGPLLVASASTAGVVAVPLLRRRLSVRRSWRGRHRLRSARHPLPHLVTWTAIAVVLLGFVTASCGPGDGPSISVAATSTFDARQADSAALAALMRDWDPSAGRWEIATSGWWSSANALTSMIDADRALGRPAETTTIATTYRLNRDHERPDFSNPYHDDEGWWGLAWLDAYRVTGDGRYLATAQDLADRMWSGWTPSCGGGITWAEPIVHVGMGGTHGDQKGAVTNELFISLAAQLGQLTGSSTDTQRAERVWAWMQHSGLLLPSGLVTDHLSTACRVDSTSAVWSYNQGALLPGLLALGDTTDARRIADASVTSPALNPDGVLTDPCAAAGNCAIDGSTFRGAMVRGLGQLNVALPDRPYSAYLHRQAQTIYSSDRMVGDLYGPSWRGPASSPNSSTQATAVDLLTAALDGEK